MYFHQMNSESNAVLYCNLCIHRQKSMNSTKCWLGDIWLQHRCTPQKASLMSVSKKTIESDYSEKLYFLWDTVRITFQIQSFLLHFFHYPTVILWSVSSLQHLHHYRRHHCINKVKQRYLPVQQKKAYYTSIPHHVLIRPND